MEPEAFDDKLTPSIESTEAAKVKMYKQMMLKRQEDRKQQLVEVVMRQTDYDEDTARNKLTVHDYDVSKTILEYMKPPEEDKEDKEGKKNSRNQMLYGEFRRFLDEASTTHRKAQEQEEKRAQYIQMLESKRETASRAMKEEITK